MKIREHEEKLYYHYCSVNTFVKIIENSTIRASNPFKMNDTQEFKWLFKFIPEVIESYVSVLTDEKQKEQYKYFYIETLTEIYEGYYSEQVNPYIACFSEEGDILSQWRSYADNSRGVAIGFSLEEFKKHQLIEIININYDLKQQKELLLQALIDFGLEDPTNLNFDRMKHVFTAATIAIEHILDKSIYCKNPAFSEEKEVRLVYNPEKYSPFNQEQSQLIVSDIQFRNDNEKLISYYDINFSEFKKEVVKEIYIGSNSKLNDRDLTLFLEKNGYYNLEIKSSASTYR
ncbi:hypothetical protein DC345_00625 [Paenibacillus taichungensis]|uniref:DUF2971 domain-containing protein n=1 Tax=Paenibacillus taichungensis TaxID=484184 RepID=A0A329R480_9BACL|nr:DUF2971 domain-containing protein [Paenibacillus taichungensis]RAW19321.1 hypothetical protein DC345_00625 [Paenibacillus taichungensis]